MIKHEEKVCPHCNQRFECKVGSIMQCQCSGVVLNEAERQYIAALYEDCLCIQCMNLLQAEYRNDKRSSDAS